MKRLSVLALVAAALTLGSASLLAASAKAERQTPRVVRRGPSAAQAVPVNPQAATTATYSAQVNIVTRVQGTSFFRTAIDISNNTTTGTTAAPVTATYQYCYTLSGLFQGCTPGATLALLAFDNFHTDDIVDYLGTQGLIPAEAQASSFGTFIVTFDHLPSGNGRATRPSARSPSRTRARFSSSRPEPRSSGSSGIRGRPRRTPARCAPTSASPTPASTA